MQPARLKELVHAQHAIASAPVFRALYCFARILINTTNKFLANLPSWKKSHASLRKIFHPIFGNAITSARLVVTGANVTRCACAILCSRRK